MIYLEIERERERAPNELNAKKRGVYRKGKAKMDERNRGDSAPFITQRREYQRRPIIIKLIFKYLNISLSVPVIEV